MSWQPDSVMNKAKSLIIDFLRTELPKHDADLTLYEAIMVLDEISADLSQKLLESTKTDINITSPSEDIGGNSCSFCKKEFKEDDEQIDTCTHTEYVKLCRKCYDEAGNSVR